MQTPRPNRLAATSFVVLLLVLAGASIASAQPQQEITEPRVTAMSQPDAATITAADAPPKPLEPKVRLSGQIVDVAANRQIMIYSPTGAVAAIAMGPAKFRVNVTESRIDFELLAGRLITTTTVPTDQQPVHLVAPSKAGPPLVDGPLAPGAAFAERKESEIEIGYQGEGPQATALNLTIAGRPASIPSAQRVTVREANVQAAPLGSWPGQHGFDLTGMPQALGVASARATRPLVHDNLFVNIIEWDREAKAQERITRLVVSGFRPDIRQTAVAVTSAQLSTTNRGAAPTSPSVANVKSIPVISPAAISVGGVTAINEANQNIRNVLLGLQSRGLGTGGLGLLLSPGLTGGIRSISPAGVAATPRRK